MLIELSKLIVTPGVLLVRSGNKRAAGWWLWLVSPLIVALGERT